MPNFGAKPKRQSKAGGASKKSLRADHVNKASSPSTSTSSSSWVDDLLFEPILSETESSALDSTTTTTTTTTSSSTVSLSIISWNILAEAYCTPRSHSNLPPSYRKHVFDPTRRRARINKVLEQLLKQNVDVFCLQEVDLSSVSSFLQSQGYSLQSTPTIKGGGAGGRCDACCCFVRDATWEIVEHELIRLDDLATMGCTTAGEQDLERNGCSNSNNNVTLEGLQQTFLRRNVALLLRLRHKQSKKTVIVATAHLYWHPGYEYVKLCQAHYILERVQAMKLSKQQLQPEEPVLFCGDLNSRPQGAVYTYLTKGWINAKLVAPWYHLLPIGETALNKNQDEEERLDEAMRQLGLVDNDDHNVDSHSENDNTPNNNQPLKVKYMLDNTLNKLCRWLRILGQDAALETEAEEKLRTRDSVYGIFDRCKAEQRTLLTTSPRMLSRRDCPPGSYCLGAKMINNLEVALVHLLLTHGVVLEPRNFLTRCVVCNGTIVEIHDVLTKRAVLQTYDAPSNLGDELEVFECDGCKQGYWWCDRPTSSASRVKNTATHLFQLCLRAGIPYSKDMNMFDYVDGEAERKQGWDYSQPGSDVLRQKLDVIGWLKDEHLKCPVRLHSAYTHRSENEFSFGETLPFTNVTDSFVNVLDYIFHNSSIQCIKRLFVPKSFSLLNKDHIHNGHLLPSDVWPSDHLAIGAIFTFPAPTSVKSVEAIGR